MTQLNIITIAGPVKSGKTNIAVLLQRALTNLGVRCTLPPDQELSRKVSLTDEELAEHIRSADIEVMIIETNLPRSQILP